MCLPLWCVYGKAALVEVVFVISKVLQMSGSELAAAPQHRSLSLGHLGYSVLWLYIWFHIQWQTKPQ